MGGSAPEFPPWLRTWCGLGANVCGWILVCATKMITNYAPKPTLLQYCVKRHVTLQLIPDQTLK